MARRAQELAAQGAPFVTATVVRAQRPDERAAGRRRAGARPTATIEGFVGGVVRRAQRARLRAEGASRRGEAVLLRILPFGEDRSGAEVGGEEGAVTVAEPVPVGRGDRGLPRAGACRRRGCSSWASTPIAGAVRAARRRARARRRRRAGDELRRPRPGDLALVVAATAATSCTRCGAPSRRACPTSAWSPARKRGDGVLGELRGDGVAERAARRASTCPPASTSARARPPEIALSILARIVEVRRGRAAVPRPPAGRRRPRPRSTRSAG